MLPQHDESLCGRALLLGEYLGLEALLEEVKAKAYANMHPDGAQDDERPAAAAFDEDVGSLADAVASKVLPARYFAPAEPAAATAGARREGADAGASGAARHVHARQLRIRRGARTGMERYTPRRSRSRASL